MKQIIYVLTAVLAAGCVQKKEAVPAPSVKAVTETLQALAKKENADFYRKDFQAWSSNFFQSPSVYWICVEDDVTLRATGWDDLSRFVSGWMKDNPMPEPDSLVRRDSVYDFQMELADSLAFVRYVKKQERPGGKQKILLENRVFKRVDGSWKIAGMVSAPGYNTPKSNNNVFVHNDASGL